MTKRIGRYLLLSCLLSLVLLLAGCACEHEFGSWTVKTSATCAAEGMEERVCTKCEESEQRSIAVIAHTYGKWSVTKKSSCTVAGEKERVCSACGGKETAATELASHSWSAATCQKAKTCKVCGVSEGNKASHSWSEANCKKAKTCTVCGVSEGTKGDHNYKNGKCTVCNASDPRYAEIANALKSMKRYPEYISYNRELIANSYELFKISGEAKYFNKAHNWVMEIHDYLEKMIKYCGDYEELSALKEDCIDVMLDMPRVPASSSSSALRSYISDAKSFARKADNLAPQYDALCDWYGVS